MKHYFAAGELIRAALETEFAAAPVNCRALRAAGWQQVRQQAQLAPAVFVWHQADRISGDRKQRGYVQQLWNTVLVVRNVETPTGAGAERDADQYIEVLLPALQDYKLSPAHQKMNRVQSQYMTAYIDGCGFYPFAFAARVLFV
jgi:hypothetical protein